MSGRTWIKSDDDYLKANYFNKSSKEIAKDMGRSVCSVYGRANLLGLKKSREYLNEMNKQLAIKLAESGEMHRFPKGHTPANKGKKMPDDIYDKVKRTMFQKGHIPANHKPVGYERLTRDGYIEVKVSEPNEFRLKHRIVWELANGPIPIGYNVQFRDGNRQNISIANLYLISRSDQMKHENSYHANYPEEVRKLIQIKGALQRQINKIKE